MKPINQNILKNIRVRSIAHSNSKEKEPIKDPKPRTPLKNTKKSTSVHENQQVGGVLKLFLNIQKERFRSMISTKTLVEPSKKRILTLDKENLVQNKSGVQDRNFLLISSPQKKQVNPIKSQIFQNSFKKQAIEEVPTLKDEIYSTYTADPQPSSFLLEDHENDKSVMTEIENKFMLKSQILQTHDISFNKSSCSKISPRNRKIYPRSQFFAVENVVSVTIRPPCLKRDMAAQTLTFQLDDKYYMEYIKYRELKNRSFEEIMNKETRLRNMIQDAQEFNKHYENLIKYINEGPENDRERRVYALSVDLEKSERKIEECFDKIYHVGREFEKNLEHKLVKSKHESKNLLKSINNLLGACIKWFDTKKPQQSRETSEQQSKPRSNGESVGRILKRVLGQFKYFQDFHFGADNYGLKVIETYHQEGTKLKEVYNEWKSMQYENRVLLYNFMKQIQKIPLFAVSLFGYDESTESIEEYLSNEKRYVEKKFEDYMETRCERCFEMKNKIRLMQHNNSQVKPVFKVVEWLVRDAKKHQNSLSPI